MFKFNKKSGGSAKPDKPALIPNQGDSKKNFILLMSLFLPILIFVFSLAIVFLRLGKPQQPNNISVSNVSVTATNYPTFSPEKPTPSIVDNSVLNPATLKETARGKIAFIEGGDVSLVNADRTGYKKLTNDDYNKFSLAFSPDGKKIAYGFYPKDESKRSNQGYYVGYHSGLAFVDVASGKITTLIKYEPKQNHYPYWLPDSKFLTVWVSNGKGAKLIDTDTATVIQNIVAEKEVSPIVWVPGKSKVSFTEDGKLYISETDGSGKTELMDGVSAYRQVHEGPNVPAPPGWSNTGRYVTFYKDADLYLLDTNTGKALVLGVGSDSEGMFGKYPQVYLLGFSKDDNLIYLLNYNDEKNVQVYNITTGNVTSVADYGQTAVLSPDKSKIFGNLKPGYTNAVATSYNLKTSEEKSCDSGFRHNYYWWAGGLGYSTSYDVWSPDSNAVIGVSYPTSTDVTIRVLLPASCYSYDLYRGKVSSPVWFPL